MTDSLALNFFVGLAVCFASTLPFGPINLTVAKVTVDKNHWRALEVAVSAALVETLQVLLAVFFGMAISQFLEDNVLFRAAVATIFLILGIYIYRRSPGGNLQTSDHYRGSEIKTGLVVAALNPQAVPFWLIALAAINDYTDLQFQGATLALFLSGVFAGKVLALGGFIGVANYLKTHLSESGRLMNHILGVVLIILGLVQWWRIILASQSG